MERKEILAELMLLAFLWDETASGTARRNTEDRLHSCSAPCFNMGQDCLWNREEHNIGDINPFVPADLDQDKLNKGWSVAQYLIHCSTCLYVGPLGQEKLDHQNAAPCCSRGSLVPE